MIRQLTYFLACALLANPVFASLRFRPDGSFKIVQFADLHYAEGETSGCKNMLPAWAAAGPCSDLNTTQFMGEVLDLEKPDVVAMTGDNCIGSSNNTKSQRAWRVPMEERNVPWFSMLGNHDAQGTLDRAGLIRVDMESPLSLTQPGPKGLYGEGNYAHQVFSSDGTKPLFNLFAMDSGAGADSPSGYDWIHPDQVAWFKQENERLGTSIPAILFFHIPVEEYDTAWPFGGACASDECVGVHKEGVSMQGKNVGLFEIASQAGNVKMINIGHDHDNDYCALYKGMQLCYGGGTGYHAYGSVGWPRRSRVLELKEDGTISSFKRLDRFGNYSKIDEEVIWSPTLASAAQHATSK
ncbi:hypothetical protein CYMTET_42036 [Cymbomonas tetramitiformis]|uniref:Calcineurin-like phosphoesterase domain-containing protein n=1 Tax=Cymbomonas tetramitiformis TaxID=36881 RepID=A0AAE0C4Y9_9CHLO|nr:hypothetical protein CYMTET_42674 [Cymbomonas tetramitiformis]KAK3248501.1 hypothetical protein CYMTET_42036 [Cymbomonas tetramitiformis]